MATNNSRSMSAELSIGSLEGGYQTGSPDRSATDPGHERKLQDLHTDWYGGMPGGSALPFARSVDERETIPTQLPTTYVGVQP